MIDVKDKHIVVIGAARSGLAAATLLKSQGASVFVSDAASLAEAARTRLEAEGIPFEEKGHTERAKSADYAVLSPGVPDASPIVHQLSENRVPIYSELEVASWFSKSPTVAVTGSNGKTTVTNWLAHMWKTAGKQAIMAGNIGFAYADHIDETAADTTVILEVSSFQLDHIDQFRPDVSIILNITPDHLNRYNNDVEAYARAKYRITENQTGRDTFIYNLEDARLVALADRLREKEDGPRLLAFSDSREVSEGVFVRDSEIIFKINNNEELLMHISDVGIPGRHNLNNGLATALAARVSEIKNEMIRECLQTFEGVQHRLEHVRTRKGIRYINDSKATNINAVWYALDSFHVPVVLILGGRDKGNDYMELDAQIREKVHTIIAIGEAREAIRSQLSDVVPTLEEAESMSEAVQKAALVAKRGEIVLLSPACASFDMFDNYEHRGDQFKQAVINL